MSSLASLFQKRNKKSKSGNTDLTNLFNNPIPQNKIQLPKHNVLKNQQKIPMVVQSVQPSTNHKKSDIKIKATVNNLETVKPINQAQKNDHIEQQQDLDATIFVGNVPLNISHSQLKKLFGSFGKVIKVWFRSIPVEQSALPRKAKHILKKYQDGADSMNAYVKFNNREQALKACSANGTVFHERNIRVSMCNDHQIDYQSTIFIGNLPHRIRDQELWDKFNHIGKIQNVRVIRNKETQEGIGIAYVRFSNNEQMKKALKQMNGIQIGDRKMRIKKAVTKDRIEKKVNKIREKKMKSGNFAGTKQYMKSKGRFQGHRPNFQKNKQIMRTKPIKKQQVQQKKYKPTQRPAKKHF